MAHERSTLVRSCENIGYCEERARREWTAAETATAPEAAAAHRLLAVQYDVEAHDMLKQLATKI
ncbi:hypothetical protein AWL63_18555 [Sphingomonas panacis]|uniref:Uncharacterized protein n=1 Tax=Sphingomonas panacis TaxID=1560345 RepID=A0A1B3ZDX2_9SPHN|nr:hypothetical protein [Sphingomonas panacis]AOH85643.1 hypothetical protein AWL63_18555 [Sphingomonas panacis]